MISMKRMRLERGMSQAALARAALMHPSSVSQIENGINKPYPSQAQKIAEVLSWEGDPSELFKEVEE